MKAPHPLTNKFDHASSTLNIVSSSSPTVSPDRLNSVNSRRANKNEKDICVIRLSSPKLLNSPISKSLVVDYYSDSSDDSIYSLEDSNSDEKKN